MSGKVKWDVPMEEALQALAATQEAAALDGRTLKILDVGGAIKPLVFATHVLDRLPYDNRAWFGRIPGEAEVGAERFTPETWYEMDAHDIPWPFKDNEFDIVWCTQTIEDLRDPIAVIREISRVGRMGYIDTIHRAFESLRDIEGPFAGFMHHRWLIEPDGDRLKFMFKFPQLHTVPEATPAKLGIRNLNLWWTGSVDAYEYMPNSPQEIYDILVNYAEETHRIAAGESV